MICDRCYQDATMGEHGLYACPLEPRRSAPTVWADDIPGGVEIAHGLCHADGTPKRFYSKSAIKAEAAAKGLVSWHEGYSEDARILQDARVYSDWLQSGESQRLKAERTAMRREGRPDLARSQPRVTR